MQLKACLREFQSKIPDAPESDHGFIRFPEGAETAEAAPEACRIDRKLMVEPPILGVKEKGSCKKSQVNPLRVKFDDDMMGQNCHRRDGPSQPSPALLFDNLSSKWDILTYPRTGGFSTAT